MTTEPTAPDPTVVASATVETAPAVDEPLVDDAVSDVAPVLGSAEVLSSASHRMPIGRIVAWVVLFVVLIALPLMVPPFRVEQMCGWIALAIAACGLNLLTGYNGQISVGHGALYGTGAYTTALLITDAGWPLLAATVASAVVCFVVGLLIGLPALRIKGLYLALVTLAVATLFPLAIDQFSSFTGGSSGLSLTSPQLYRGAIRDRPIRFEAPNGGLDPDQWKYFIFLAVAVLCFVLSRNLIHSRVGRTLVAIRDNETASEVSGVAVSRTKIVTFGVSAALAGIGGSVFALNTGRVNPSSFTIAVSIYFLIAVVVGGAASVIGPAIGAVFYGVFIDVLSPELPERMKPATPVILGVLLILLMLVAPGGIVGLWKTTQHKPRSDAPDRTGPDQRRIHRRPDLSQLSCNHVLLHQGGSMNTNWKRVGAVLFTLVLVASACGGRDDDSSSSDSGSSSGSESSTSAFINPDTDCTDYKGTQGVEGDTIKIGTIRPASGPYAIYDQVTTGMEAYFKSANSSGGIKAGDGKSYQVELIKEDDGYDPARTPGVAKKLVEQDGVFALVGDIGTEPSLAIRDYMNDNCVPNVALGTGSPEWGRANEYPWYISALPSYALEAKVWIDYLKQNKPDAKIASLYQSDDFGEAYQRAIANDIEQTDITVVAEKSYNPLGGTTTEAAVTELSQSGADVFIVGVGGTPCPATLKFVPDSWKPMTFISITCAGKTALSLAGGKDVGVLAAQATYDPSDPADKTNPKVTDFVSKASAAGLDQNQIEGGIATAGWGFAALFAAVLAKTKTVDRAELMNTLFSLDVPAFGLLRDDIDVQTDGDKDPWAIEGLRVVERTAQGGWTEKAPVTNYNGKSNSFVG